MKKEIIILVLLIIAGCGQDPEKITAPLPTTGEVHYAVCPSNCDDRDVCTHDYCSNETNYYCMHDMIVNCCGNNNCESAENYENCEVDCPKPQLSSELADLLSNREKVTSYQYTHYEEGLEVIDYVYKEDLAEARLKKPKNPSFGVFYDTVFLDLRGKNALGFCRSDCEYDGNVHLDYEEYYRTSPDDILKMITHGTTTKTANTWGDKPSTLVEYQDLDGRSYKVTIWDHYSIPLIYEEYLGSKLIRKIEFRGMRVNTIDEISIPENAIRI